MQQSYTEGTPQNVAAVEEFERRKREPTRSFKSRGNWRASSSRAALFAPIHPTAWKRVFSTVAACPYS